MANDDLQKLSKIVFFGVLALAAVLILWVIATDDGTRTPSGPGSSELYRYDKPLITEGENGNVYVLPAGTYTRKELEDYSARVIRDEGRP